MLCQGSAAGSLDDSGQIFPVFMVPVAEQIKKRPNCRAFQSTDDLHTFDLAIELAASRP